MGMSSSQARLLSLSRRMHDIESKAQNLEAQKLQMANESKHVYKEYENALNNTKIQFGHLTSNCAFDYTDATLATLENGLVSDYDGVTSPNHYLLQNSDTNEIYITSQFAESYNLTENTTTLPNLETFLTDEGCTKTYIYGNETDYSNIISATPIANNKIKDYSTIPGGVTYTLSSTLATPTTTTINATTKWQSSGTKPNVDVEEAVAEIVGGSFINKVTPKTEVPDGYTAIYTADDLASIGDVYGGQYILMNDIDMSGVDWTPVEAMQIKLDGNGYKITGLNNALFSQLINTCEITNLGLEGSTVADGTGGYNVALIGSIAKDAKVTIDNCYVANADLGANNNADTYTAGFIGYVNDAEVNISSSYVNANTGTRYGTQGFVAKSSAATINIDANSYHDIYNTYQLISSTSGADITYKGADNSIQGTPATTYPTESEAGKGTLKISTDADMERYIAYEIMGAENYEENLASLQSKNYTAYQLAEIIAFSAAYEESLKAGTTINSFRQYTTDKYELDQASIDKYSVNEVIVTPEVKTVHLASKNDILLQLASDIADEGTNPEDVMTQLLKKYPLTNNDVAANIQYYYVNDKTTYNQIIQYFKDNNGSRLQDLLDSGNRWTSYDKIEFATTDKISVNEITLPDTEILGQVNIPSIDGIASNLVVALRKAGYTVDETTIKNLLKTKLNTNNNANNITLANINEALVKYIKNGSNKSEVDNIYNYIQSKNSLNITQVYNASKFQATRNVSGTCAVQYGTKTGTTVIGEEWKKDNKYYDALEKYETLKAMIEAENKYIIVDDELANSTEFLSTMLDNGCILLSLTKGMNQDGFREASVSTETCLQEVVDETELKKAEAKYEADMRKINAKDKKFDTDLAALEAERNAIKAEQETLKSIIKDNVDRTFKLFG